MIRAFRLFRNAQNAQGSDTTGDATCTAAGCKNLRPGKEGSTDINRLRCKGTAIKNSGNL